MKKLLVIMPLILMVLPIHVYGSGLKFSRCIDGDTFEALLNDELIKVRLLAIDTPELNTDEYFSLEAADYTCKLISEHELTFEYDNESDQLDKYGRHLMWVYVDDMLLQELIISDGYGYVAYLYGDYKYTDLLLEAEEDAIKNGLNIHKKGLNPFRLSMIFIMSIFIIYLIIKIILGRLLK